MLDDEPIRAHLARLEAKIDSLAARGVTMRHVIFQMREIARVCGVSERSVWRWIHHPVHPLRIVHLGRLGCATTLHCIDEFIERKALEEQSGPPRRSMRAGGFKWQKGESGNPRSGKGKQSTPATSDFPLREPVISP